MSSSEKELVEYRANLKNKLQKEFLRQYWDPYRHASHEGGTVFDPAIQRYLSMKACQYDYFKVTKKTILMGIANILPFFIMGYFVYKERSTLDHKCSTGQIAYKDRRHRFLT